MTAVVPAAFESEADVKQSSIRVDFRVAILYAFFGGLWILLSDYFLSELVKDVHAVTTIQTYKGWAYVLFSSALIFFLLRRDLFQNRLATSKLRESEERNRLVLQNSLDAILITSPDGSILSANPSACAMFQMTEEMICKVGRRGVVDASDSRLAVLLNERERTGRVKGELTMVRNNGEKFPVEITTSVYVDHAGNNRTSMIIRDISERKRTEQALSESEERYRTLVTFSPYALYVHVDERITLVNPAMCKLLRADQPSQLIGKSVFDIVAPAYHETIRKRWELVFSGHPAPLIEEQFVRLDGTLVDVEVKAVAIDLRDRKEVQVVAHDITERKLTELASKRAAEDIRISHNQLRAFAAYLQKIREEERTAMAREIHDELGQRLTALKMDLAWLNKRTGGDDIESVHEKIKTMSSQVDDTIQRVRKIATGLRPGILDDLGLIPSIEWQAKEFQERSGVRCTVTSDCETVDLDGESTTAVFRIFQEALTNVARHAQATAVAVHVRKDNSSLMLEVCDNGKGIETDRIFATASLGLRGMMERAMLLNGGVRIVSGETGGTKVIVTVPITTVQEAGR